MIKANGNHLTRFGAIWALIAGAALILAFAPFNLFAIGVLSPALFLAILLFSTRKQAFLRGYLYGLAFFGAGIYWVFNSLHVYGQAPALLAVFITVAFIAFLALYPALTGYLLNRFFPKNNFTKAIFAFPVLWLFFDWLRSWIFSGFPWLLLGYSQISSPLRGLAPIGSVYLVSLATLISAGLLVSIIYLSKRSRTSLWLLVSLALLWSVSAGLASIQWTKPDGKSIKVSLIQGNIAQSVKWEPQQLEKSLATYTQLTEQHWDSQIIVWPEAAITVPKQYIQEFINRLIHQANQHHAAIITGIPLLRADTYYNGMIVLGNGHGEYAKRHLVPFGEYLPLRFLFQWFNRYVLIPMSDLGRGALHQGPFIAAGIHFAPYICYEIIFTREVLATIGNAQMIIVISDDSWFGRSAAPIQQLQMTQMRALETGRYVLSATNDGVTAIVKPNGAIADFIGPFIIGVLSATAQPMTGATPVMLIGLWPTAILAIFLFLIALLAQFMTRTNN